MFKDTCCLFSLSVVLLNVLSVHCFTFELPNSIDMSSIPNELQDTSSSENRSAVKNYTTFKPKPKPLDLSSEEIPAILLQPSPGPVMKQFKQLCPETEHPASIGTYEIPTQRDLVMFTTRMLTRAFNKYHEKTLVLLKDIKEATKSTVAIENKCVGKKEVYRRCVKEVGKKFITITKELVKELEQKKRIMANMTEGKVCSLSSMKTNPMDLIKVLAVDEITLDFALPGYLRSLGGCSAKCDMSKVKVSNRLPTRHMSDQDLVVKHFLTSKTYEQIIKNSYA